MPTVNSRAQILGDIAALPMGWRSCYHRDGLQCCMGNSNDAAAVRT